VYRFGDGTPFPLEENFIDTLTSAVESCTAAFMPLTELDTRRERARAGKLEAEKELARLGEFENNVTNALAPYLANDRKTQQTHGIAQKILQAAKQAVQQARTQTEGRAGALEAQGAARTASDAVLHALRPFFENHQLPETKWIMSWDVRGGEPSADAVATSGRLAASFKLTPDPYRQPIRVDTLAEAVIVHMMKKGLLGKAKPAPVELGKYVLVAYEQTVAQRVVTLRENPHKPSQGLRFAVGEHGATWQSLAPNGDAETEANPLDVEDLDGIRRLSEAAGKTLKDLVTHRTMVDLTLGGQALTLLPEPRVVPMEVLAQLTPLARTIRQRSRVHGELVLKKDLGGGRREELFVPRATLAQAYAKLPEEYRHPFEEMGITSEDTQPAIVLPRPPAKPPAPPTAPPDAKTIEVKK
jgi:hypothetical protein